MFRYFSDVARLVYELAHKKPSIVAAASMYLASFAHRHAINSVELEKLFNVPYSEVIEVSRILVEPAINFMKPSEKLRALREKYNDVSLAPLQIRLLRSLTKKDLHFNH